MEYINPVRLSSFLKKITFLSLVLSVAGFAHGQCPVPFPNVDTDSTYENIAKSTVVTRNDVTYFGSGVRITNDSLSISQNPAHGTVVILNDSTIRYTPNLGFVGTDFYSYLVCDSCGSCGQASVSIRVSAYCPPPVAIADRDTVYNDFSRLLNVTANDSNTVGWGLTLSVTRNPRHGTATVSGSGILYSCTQSGYVGVDTIQYAIQDTCPAGRNRDSAFVYLQVIACQLPVAVNDTFTVEQQSSISGNLTANDLHITGFGNVSLSLLNTPKFGGIATLSGTTITYTGGSRGTGRDTIRYQVCTDCGCDTAFAVFTVTFRPCARPGASPDIEFTGYSPHCASTFDVLINDTLPINGGTPVVRLLDTAFYGTASIVGNSVHYVAGDSARTGETDLVHYSVCNSCFCDTSYVVINFTNYTCNGVNPIINADTGHICTGYTVVVDATANDYSSQGFTVTVNSITGQGLHGTAAVVSGSNVQYTPDAHYAGLDRFFYKACDNGTPSLCNIGEVFIYVDSCNAPPVILGPNSQPADTLYTTIWEDSSEVYCFAYTTTDSPQVYIASISPSGSADSVVSNSPTPGTNPCITITPARNSRAQQTAQVVICTETPVCDTVLVIINILPVHHAPKAANDTLKYNWSSPCSSVNVLANDTMVNPGDKPVITYIGSSASFVSQTGDSTLCYTADSSFTGIDTFFYVVCNSNDSALCDTAYVTVTVPLLARADNALTQEDSAISISVTANDTRAAGEYITLCSEPRHGTAAIDSGNIVSYTPAHDYPVDPFSSDTLSYIGVDSFCYTLCRSVGTDTICSSAMVYVEILPLSKFTIPQGISPNGDGINDFFVISAANQFPLSQLLVYNRYGEEVWRNDSNGYQNDFDGTWKKNGQPLPDGSYWYIFKFNDGVTHDRMGYIVIQR